MKKWAVLVGVVMVAVVVGGYGFVKMGQRAKEGVPQAVDIYAYESEKKKEAGVVKAEDNAVTELIEEMPKELNFAMDFYTQAPFGDWSEPWQNACEEASILLVVNNYEKHNWTKAEFRDEVLKLVEWEKKTFGDYVDTTAAQMVKILDEFGGLKGVIHKNPTYEDVQKVLVKGHLILMPFDGKKIGNPFYKNGGPEYHVMVIKGYKEGQKVITEDVGTMRGEDYVYAWTTLQKANHDYAHPVESGGKVMIEVLPPMENL